MQTDSMREQLVTQAILALQGSLYRLAFSYGPVDKSAKHPIPIV